MSGSAKVIRKVSVVIRTLNEGKHLPDLLAGIRQQDCPGIEVETVLVDSGSTDDTIEIAQGFGVRIVHIKKEDFSFGRSLNYGCAAATGDALVFVSGHCVPTTTRWIADLVAPLGKSDMVLTYGGQCGNRDSHFSERRIFQKYFPPDDHLPQEGFYCSNANSALLKEVWVTNPFDEELTGLEDMHLAKRLVTAGHKIGYVASASVFHLHDESWAQIRRRFEREAIALQYIMPEVHLNAFDVVRYFALAVVSDLLQSIDKRCFWESAADVLIYRFMQFTGSYRGNHFHRKLSRERKEQYFYPNRKAQTHVHSGNYDEHWKTMYRRPVADEGK
jgi:glycosyltransferase involved in cell wall biosynthesis